jgi:hypothetical protein
MSLQQIIQNFVSARDKIPQIHNNRLVSAGSNSSGSSPNWRASEGVSPNRRAGEGVSPNRRAGGGVRVVDAQEESEEEASEMAPSEMEMMFEPRTPNPKH